MSKLNSDLFNRNLTDDLSCACGLARSKPEEEKSIYRVIKLNKSPLRCFALCVPVSMGMQYRSVIIPTSLYSDAKYMSS